MHTLVPGYNPNNNFFTRKVGEKNYELTDHASTTLSTGASTTLSTGASTTLSTGASTTLSTGLGNVRATVTDRKVASFQYPQSGNWTITGFTADITSAQDYYPGGMMMPGRKFNPDKYEYGFNGMMMDNEIKGVGNSYTTYFRQYDPRIMRWFSRDPITHPWQSDYAAFNNNPIYYTDASGAKGDPPVKRGDKFKDKHGNERTASFPEFKVEDKAPGFFNAVKRIAGSVWDFVNQDQGKIIVWGPMRHGEPEYLKSDHAPTGSVEEDGLMGLGVVMKVIHMIYEKVKDWTGGDTEDPDKEEDDGSKPMLNTPEDRGVEEQVEQNKERVHTRQRLQDPREQYQCSTCDKKFDASDTTFHKEGIRNAKKKHFDLIVPSD